MAYEVGKKYKGMADFTKADGTTGVIYTDVTPVKVEASDPAVVSFEIVAPPADNAYPNNPVHVIATVLKAGSVTVKATCADADPAEGPQALELSLDMECVDAVPPSTGGTFTLDPTPLP